MVKMVNDYGFPGELSLTEETVSELVKWKNNDNVVARIQFLESNQKIYQSYGGYWLILADAYYNNGEFKNCIDAVTTYESMGTRLFRWDYEYAKILPLAVASAEQVLPEDESAELNNLIADKIPDIPLSISEFDFSSNYSHRKYTHRGWNLTYDEQAHWPIRQKILLNTIRAKLFSKVESPISWFPWLSDKVYGNGNEKQCEAFAVLVSIPLVFLHLQSPHISFALESFSGILFIFWIGVNQMLTFLFCWFNMNLSKYPDDQISNRSFSVPLLDCRECSTRRPVIGKFPSSGAKP